MRILVATRNRHKLREIRRILYVPGIVLMSIDESPDLPEVEEDGVTFEENAVKKAATLARASGLWTLADDSGLEVDALNGAPGVYSARYAGEPVDYHANNLKLLKELKSMENRTARFRCVIALCDADGSSRTVEGVCEGEITEGLRGDNGFGYDPVFRPQGHQRTFAEMTEDEKNAISHRFAALMKAKQAWSELLTRP